MSSDPAVVVSEVRARGWRMTTGRRAVIGALAARDRHRGADELAAEVHAAHPEVHRSTIYRTLDALERLGVVQRMQLRRGAAVYSLVSTSEQQLLCEVCGRVVRVAADLLDPLTAEAGERHDFVLRPGRSVLVGRCRTCPSA